MQALRDLFSDRIRFNALLLVASFAAVLTLTSQSAASYPTYLLALSMLLSIRRWNDVFATRSIWCVVALIAYLCASSLWSEPFRWRDVGSMFTRGVLVVAFVVALAECQLRGQVQLWMGRTLGLIGAAVASLALISFFLDPPETDRLRGFGQLDHPVVAGLILGVVVVFLVQVLLSDRSRAFRWLSAAGLVPVAAAIALTGSRNAWASTFIGVFVYLFAHFVRDRGKFVAALLGLLVTTAVLIAALALNEDTREIVLPRGDSFRLDIWSTVSANVLDRSPLFGLGISTPDDVEIEGEIFHHAHNMYLAVTVQGGLVGLGLFGLVIAVTLFNAYRRFEHPDAKLCLGVVSIALASYVLDGHELIDKVGETWYLFWLPVALGVGISWNLLMSTRERISS